MVMMSNSFIITRNGNYTTEGFSGIHSFNDVVAVIVTRLINGKYIKTVEYVPRSHIELQ